VNERRLHGGLARPVNFENTPPGTLRKLQKHPRTIRRCGELLKLVADTNRGRPSAVIQDGSVPNFTRTQAATDAGLSERQRKSAHTVGIAQIRAV
jgi:hypothetical protein